MELVTHHCHQNIVFILYIGYQSLVWVIIHLERLKWRELQEPQTCARRLPTKWVSKFAPPTIDNGPQSPSLASRFLTSPMGNSIGLDAKGCWHEFVSILPYFLSPHWSSWVSLGCKSRDGERDACGVWRDGESWSHSCHTYSSMCFSWSTHVLLEFPLNS